MILVIDVGNTNMTMGVFSKEKMQGNFSHYDENTENFG